MSSVFARTQSLGSISRSRPQPGLLLAIGVAIALLCGLFAGTAQARRITIKRPLAGRTVSGKVPFRAAVKGHPRSVSFFVDGRRLSTDRKRPYGFGRSGRLNTSRLSAGIHRLSVVARYHGGRRARAWIDVMVVKGRHALSADTTAPKVVWRAPIASQTVRGRLSESLCEVGASDDRGVSQVRFYADGTQFDSERVAPYNCFWDTRALRDGRHTLKAVAVDAAGNLAQSSIEVTVMNGTSSGPSNAPTASDPGGLVWKADFETGNLSQWEGVQQFAPGRASAVSSPSKQGMYSGRFEVRAGEFLKADAPTRNRTEAVLSVANNRHNPHEGSDWWYGWWFYLPASTPLPHQGTTEYMSMMQHITTAPVGSPDWDIVGILEFRDNKASGDPGSGHVELSYTGSAGSPPFPGAFWTKDQAAVTRDTWHRIVLHKKWSSDPSVGFVEIWYDGAQQTMMNGSTRVHHANLRPGYSAYMKQGIYRSDRIGGNAVMYLDDVRIGTSRAAVGG
jgi:hypothetical protein